MPDLTITAPVAADPIDRLTLGATDARDAVGSGLVPAFLQCGIYCMAEE
jgi:hypothetical protein